jgi:hypothetical protein
MLLERQRGPIPCRFLGQAKPRYDGGAMNPLIRKQTALTLEKAGKKPEPKEWL